MIDTHSHLYLDAFKDDRSDMVQRAIDTGVKTILLPNIDLESIEPMHQLCDEFPESIFPMMGLHPCDVKENYLDVLAEMRTHFNTRKYIAVGETGIDLYWDKTTLDIQIQSFKIQIEWAKELSLPIVIHARDSFDEIISVLEEVNDESLKGVFHCFGGSKEQADKVISLGGFMMGIGGIITYEKSGLAETATHIPLDYLVLETDSPFLTPKPYRGKRNESAYTRIIAQKIADVTQRSVDEIAEITTSNARRLFHL